MADTGVCRHCGARITFIRLAGDNYDWCAHLGTSLCASTTSGDGRHHPVNPIEGIDY